MNTQSNSAIIGNSNAYNIQNGAKTICRNIKRSLNKFNLSYEATLVNNNKCIQVIGTGIESTDLYIWIRLLYRRDRGKYIVEINNVYLPENLQGRHIFSTIFKGLCTCKYVCIVAITSVSTEQMKVFCDTHNMKNPPYQPTEYYIDVDKKSRPIQYGDRLIDQMNKIKV